MLDSVRSNQRLRRITQAWFWEDMFYAVSDFVRSRSVWVVVGNAGTFLSALAGLVYHWSRPLSFAGCAVIQLACLACLVGRRDPGRVAGFKVGRHLAAPQSCLVPAGVRPARPGGRARIASRVMV